MFDYWHAQRAWGIGLSTYLVDERGQVCVNAVSKTVRYFSENLTVLEK
jgi:hypothetical protein